MTCVQETLFSPTPSGLVLGTKLGTVDLTPEGPKDPRYSKDCERVWRATLGKISPGGRIGDYIRDLFATNQPSR